MKKTCTKCKEEKTLDNFAKNKTRRDGLQNYCRTCLSAYKRKDYRLDPEKKKRYVKRRRKELKGWLNKYKSDRGCSRCGYNEHPSALQCHHVDPNTKNHNVSEMLVGYSINNIEKELKKCEILCANCHSIEHYTPL